MFQNDERLLRAGDAKVNSVPFAPQLTQAKDLVVPLLRTLKVTDLEAHRPQLERCGQHKASRCFPVTAGQCGLGHGVAAKDVVTGNSHA
jgi:hypothetical protein